MSERASERAQRVLPWLWPVLLTLLITAPLLAPGFVVGYDLVFVPDLTVRLDLFGVTTAMPRAVPSDILVALADEITGGQVLDKLVLVAIPLLSGLGMTALWRELRLGGALPGAAAATLYLWNPFVAERLRLGAWALLLGYAALPWLVRSAVRLRRGQGWPGFVIASAGCALTASGGITGLLVAGLILLWPPRAPKLWPLGAAVLLNAPWLVAGLTHGGSSTTDPASVAAFAARDEGYGGTLPTLLTLGGAWNANVVPGNRGDLAAADLRLRHAGGLRGRCGPVVATRSPSGCAGRGCRHRTAHRARRGRRAGCVRSSRRARTRGRPLPRRSALSATTGPARVDRLRRCRDRSAGPRPPAEGGRSHRSAAADRGSARTLRRSRPACVALPGRLGASTARGRRPLHPVAVRVLSRTGVERTPPGARPDAAVLRAAVGRRRTS